MSQMATEFPRVYTVPEVAKLLRVGRRTVDALIARGDLSVMRVYRGSIRVREEDLIEYCNRILETRGPADGEQGEEE